MLDLFLLHDERDLRGIITGNKSAAAKTVNAIFNRARSIVGVEGSDSAEVKAHRNASQAFFFSRYC